MKNFYQFRLVWFRSFVTVHFIWVLSPYKKVEFYDGVEWKHNNLHFWFGSNCWRRDFSGFLGFGGPTCRGHRRGKKKEMALSCDFDRQMILLHVTCDLLLDRVTCSFPWLPFVKDEIIKSFHSIVNPWILRSSEDSLILLFWSGPFVEKQQLADSMSGEYAILILIFCILARKRRLSATRDYLRIFHCVRAPGIMGARSMLHAPGVYTRTAITLSKCTDGVIMCGWPFVLHSYR